MKEPLSPLREMRLALGISAKDFASLAGINYSAVDQTEAGLYRTPPPAYLQALTKFSVDVPQLIKAYKDYQIAKRRYNGAQTNQILIINPQFSYNENPLKSWREQSGLAVYRLATSFALHLPLINIVENRIFTIKKPPKELLDVLTDAQYNEVLGLLEEFVETFYLYKTFLTKYLAHTQTPTAS